MRAYVWLGREPTFLEVSLKNWHLRSTMKDNKVLNRFNYRTSQRLQRATVPLEEPRRGNSISWIDLISSSFSLEHVVGLAPHSTRGTILVPSAPTDTKSSHGAFTKPLQPSPLSSSFEAKTPVFQPHPHALPHLPRASYPALPGFLAHLRNHTLGLQLPHSHPAAMGPAGRRGQRRQLEEQGEHR